MHTVDISNYRGRFLLLSIDGLGGRKTMVPERKPVIISGPSGAGKNVLICELLRHGYAHVMPTTTRSIRAGEIDGVDYHFISEVEFVAQKERSELYLDFGMFGYHYGHSWSALKEVRSTECIPVMHLHISRIDDAITLFPDVFRVWLSPSAEELDQIRERVRERAFTEAEYQQRLEAFETETKLFEDAYARGAIQCVIPVRIGDDPDTWVKKIFDVMARELHNPTQYTPPA